MLTELDRSTMTEDSHHKADKVSMEWYDLGIQLMVPSSLLDSIKATSGNNIRMCYTKMFEYWLQEIIRKEISKGSYVSLHTFII